MDSSWIVPGANVVVLRAVSTGMRLIGKSKVESVAKQSFKVAGVEQRFRLRDLQTAGTGGAWSRNYYSVIVPGSDQHLKLAAAAHLDAAESAAEVNVAQWRRNRRDFAQVTAAIDALTALRDALGGGS